MTKKEKERQEREKLQLQLLLYNIPTWECIALACLHKGMYPSPDPRGIYASYFARFPLRGMKVMWEENSRSSVFALSPELREAIGRMGLPFWHLRELGTTVERYATACARVYGALTFLDFTDIFHDLVGFDPLFSVSEIQHMITSRTLSPYTGYMVDSEHTIIYNPCLFDLAKEDYMPDVRRFVSEAAQKPRWKPRTKKDLYKYSETYAGGKASLALKVLLVTEWGLDPELPMDPIYLNLCRSFTSGGSVGDHLESIADFLMPDPRQGGAKTLRLISAISAAEKDFRNPRLGGFRRGDKIPGGTRPVRGSSSSASKGPCS